MISIIIPIYNYKYISNISTALASLHSQNVEKEVIVSDNSKLMSAEIYDICSKFRNTKYIFSEMSMKGGNLGLARNKAAKISSGNYLYFTDADIVLYNKQYLNYLMRLVECRSKCVTIQPKMYRLAKNIEMFQDDFKNKIKIDYNFNNNCLYEYTEKQFCALKELKRNFDGQPYVCMEEEYNYSRNLNLDKIEELIWKPFYHWGGIFCRKEYFEDVGGYSSEYYNWGCEDADLIEKLKSKYKLIYMHEEIPNLSVLHLEHPRKYNNENLKLNIRILNGRKNRLTASISRDVEEYEKL